MHAVLLTLWMWQKNTFHRIAPLLFSSMLSIDIKSCHSVAEGWKRRKMIYGLFWKPLALALSLVALLLKLNLASVATVYSPRAPWLAAVVGIHMWGRGGEPSLLATESRGGYLCPAQSSWPQAAIGDWSINASDLLGEVWIRRTRDLNSLHRIQHKWLNSQQIYEPGALHSAHLLGSCRLYIYKC